MPNIGVTGIGTGLNVGISLNEIMMIATTITFLFAIIPPLGNPSGVDILDFPPAIWGSFNTLWFNDFRFFGDTGGSCIEPLSSITNLRYGSDVMGNVLEGEGGGGGGIGAGGVDDIDYTDEGEGYGVFDILFETFDSVVGLTDGYVNALLGSSINVFYLLVSILGILGNILMGCGLGGIRLVIGSAIFVYWFGMLVNFFGGISGIANLVDKLF